MLYRRTVELIELSSTKELPETEVVLLNELSDKKAIWLEGSLTKTYNGNSYQISSDNVSLVVSRKVNLAALIDQIDNISVTNNASINTLTATNTSADYLYSNDISSIAIETNNITALYGDISVLTSINITTDHISSNVGVINQLRSTNIYTTNITVTGIAQLSAAAAYWADLAEYYKSDEIYKPGTLIQFGQNDNEITLAKTEANAIITEKPAITINTKISETSLANAIILVGRSKVRTIGKINKFDKLYLSDIPGIASAKENGKVLGIALESNNNIEEKTIEAIVKLNI